MPSSNEPKYFRDFSNVSKEHFLEEISHIDFMGLITEDVNKSMNNIVERLQLISNKHSPFRKVLKQKKRKLKKPWISKAILISIKKNKGFSNRTSKAMSQVKLKNIRQTKISYTEL